MAMVALGAAIVWTALGAFTSVPPNETVDEFSNPDCRYGEWPTRHPMNDAGAV
jgi:hypothetical protein